MDYLQLVPAAWRLRFPDATEKEFIDYYNVTTINAIRISLAVGVILYAAFGLLDLNSLPITTSTAWFYRFSVGCPAIFIALIFSYITPLRALLQVVMTVMCIVAGLALVLIVRQSQPTELAYDHYYVGVIIIMMFTGSWVRLRFWHALAAHTIIIGAYFILVSHARYLAVDRHLIVNNTVFLLAAYFVASLTCYIFEVDSRIGFLQWKTIEAEKNTSNLQREELSLQAQQLAETIGILKDTQAQLVQREKMAALGELTAGVAHEIQNPLNFVKNFAEVSREMLEEMQQSLANEHLTDPGAATVLTLLRDLGNMQQKIGQHSQRADAIVKGMLEHSRSTGGNRQPTNLNRLAEEALRLSYHNRQIQEPAFTANLATDFDPHVGMVSVASTDIQRVLLNLFGNAFYSVSHKKQRLGAAFTPQVKVATKRRGKGVEIRVRDNGTGMSKEVLQKLFQPFFTTKPPGEGTGLGLSISHDIITSGHGGTITATSQSGEYAEFCITLPAM
ncbi:ATP-binding protein [Hymenobacter sp. BT770]|uniref:sensor histidine kinase n=1 Tax=Hymenobacter sp. BT770 TaxID=2886942 RepID=UPI001D12B7A8|nr:ATP-binding protein [Hymenobacter sp. BT770]MCC3155352.1 hypothetical protein [Hymenobacter sp. BT770]MDO3417385.1 ATP-binding protein [Hymenobacter sp. BT770]